MKKKTVFLRPDRAFLRPDPPTRRRTLLMRARFVGYRIYRSVAAAVAYHAARAKTEGYAKHIS